MIKSAIFALLLILNFQSFAQHPTTVHNSFFTYSTSDSAKTLNFINRESHSLAKMAILPISLISAGIVVELVPAHTLFGKERIREFAENNLGGWKTRADNLLQFGPLAALYSFKVCGIESRSDLVNQAIITAKSELLMLAIVNSMKYFIHDTRPDGSSDNSMPSGHTAQAFLSATLLDMEYRETSPWISAAGYLCATATGFLRVTNNRHWASDVLIGAGIGIASVRVVYLTHRYRWGKKPSGVLMPMLFQNGGGVTFAMKF